MGLAVISNNITTKLVAPLHASVNIASNATTTLFTVPANTCYEITALAFSSALSNSNKLLINLGGVDYELSGEITAALVAGQNTEVSNLTSTNINANIIKSVQNGKMILTFRSPLIMPEGSILKITNSGGGSGATTIGIMGKALQNTP